MPSQGHTAGERQSQHLDSAVWSKSLQLEPAWPVSARVPWQEGHLVGRSGREFGAQGRWGGKAVASISEWHRH